MKYLFSARIPHTGVGEGTLTISKLSKNGIPKFLHIITLPMYLSPVKNTLYLSFIKAFNSLEIHRRNYKTIVINDFMGKTIACNSVVLRKPINKDEYKLLMLALFNLSR